MANRYSISDVAEKLSVEKETARGLVKFLEAKGLAEYKGDRKPENRRGALESVYSFSEDFEMATAQLLASAQF